MTMTALTLYRDDTGADWYFLRLRDVSLINFCAKDLRRFTGLQAKDLAKGQTREVTITLKVGKVVKP